MKGGLQRVADVTEAVDDVEDRIGTGSAECARWRTAVYRRHPLGDRHGVATVDGEFVLKPLEWRLPSLPVDRLLCVSEDVERRFVWIAEQQRKHGPPAPVEVLTLIDYERIKRGAVLLRNVGQGVW